MHFLNCELSKVSLSEKVFSDCIFEGCNLGMADLAHTTLAKCTFRNCKLIGLRFCDCNPFLLAVSFENCILDYATFYKLNLKQTHFSDCSLREADFTEANLQEAAFTGCDLMLAQFDNTNLEGADLTTAYHYNIDPTLNKVRKARFSVAGVAGLLNSFGVIIEP